jgi:hypothetical protein
MGVISKENRKKFSDFLDKIVKLKNPILESVDGWVFSTVVSALDDNFLSKVKPEFHPLIDRLFGEVGDEDYKTAAGTLGEILALAIKTPLVDGTPSEIEMYKKVFELIATLIQTAVEKEEPAVK